MINNIIVIGSGVMGLRIAAQIANSGHQVHLLDIVIDGNQDRNFLSKAAINKLNHSDIVSCYKNNIIPGNIDDDIELIADADWIIEVIIENLQIKQNLYLKLEKICKKNCFISSNTSTIRLKDLIAGRSEQFKQNFVITHFFNPPRYMELLEFITSDNNNLDQLQILKDFIEVNIGKTIIATKDTPGFIANRIGCYWLMLGLDTALKLKIPFDQADNEITKLTGIPKTGIFGLFDLIGIDVMNFITNSLSKNLAENDEFKKTATAQEFLKIMIDKGLIGRKSNAGFYRVLSTPGNEKVKQVLEINNFEYRDLKQYELKIDQLEKLFDVSVYAKEVMLKTINYAVSLLDEIANNFSDIDLAMQLGYNWQFGPFKLIDLIGPENFKKILSENNIKIADPILKLKKGDYFYPKNQELSQVEEIILSNQHLKIYSHKKHIALFKLTSKMGILNHNVFELILEFFEKYAHKFNAIIITNTHENFSAGGDLKFMLKMAEEKNWPAIDEYLKLGQQVMLKIKNSSIPVAIALKGIAYGGGSEILLHAHGVAAHIEAKCGLVETKVGIIPAWGGCKEIILRSQSEEELIRGFKNIILANISTSAYDLQELLNLKKLKIVMNKNYVLEGAEKLCDDKLERARSDDLNIKVNWQNIIADMKLSGFNLHIANKLAEIFSLETRDEDTLLAKEREIFLELIAEQDCQQRIKKIVKKNDS